MASILYQYHLYRELNTLDYLQLLKLTVNPEIRHFCFQLPLGHQLLATKRNAWLRLHDPTQLEDRFLLAVTDNDVFLTNELIQAGVNPALQDNRPLTLAALYRYPEMVSHLLQDPRVTPKARGGEARIFAQRAGFPEIVELLSC